MSSSNTDNGQAFQQHLLTQPPQQMQQDLQTQQILYIQGIMQTQQNLQIQNQKPQQGNGSSRSSRPRSKLPCPQAGCDGDGCERYVMIHTHQCKVSGCPLNNPFFVNVETLGAHLIDDHNNGDHNYCHWPGCDPKVKRASNNNMVHVRLHNHRL